MSDASVVNVEQEVTLNNFLKGILDVFAKTNTQNCAFDVACELESGSAVMHFQVHLEPLRRVPQ